MKFRRALKPLSEVRSSLGYALVDRDTGPIVGAEAVSDGFDVDLAACGAISLLKRKEEVLEMMGLDEVIERIVINVGGQHHIIQPVSSWDGLVIFFAIDAKQGHLEGAAERVTEVANDRARWAFLGPQPPVRYAAAE